MQNERCHRFIRLGAVVTSLFVLVGCEIDSSYDISADLRQEFPFDSGAYSSVVNGENKLSYGSNIRTVDGYDSFLRRADSPAHRSTVRFFKMPNYDKFALQVSQDSSLTDTRQYIYLLIKVVANDLDVYLFEEDENVSANLSNLVKKTSYSAIFAPLNPTRDTLNILRELSKIEMRKVITVARAPSSTVTNAVQAGSCTETGDNLELAYCHSVTLKAKEQAMIAEYTPRHLPKLFPCSNFSL